MTLASGRSQKSIEGKPERRRTMLSRSLLFIRPLVLLRQKIAVLCSKRHQGWGGRREWPGMHVLRTMVQAVIAAIVLLKFVSGAVIAPAEASLVFATEYIVINNVSKKPQKTTTGLNTISRVDIERFFNNFLIRHYVCGSRRPTETLVHLVSRVAFGGRRINFPSADCDLSRQRLIRIFDFGWQIDPMLKNRAHYFYYCGRFPVIYELITNVDRPSLLSAPIFSGVDEFAKRSRDSVRNPRIYFDEDVGSLQIGQSVGAVAGRPCRDCGCISGYPCQPCLPACHQNKNDCEYCDNGGGDGVDVVMPFIDTRSHVAEKQPSVVDGAIIVIGIGVALIA